MEKFTRLFVFTVMALPIFTSCNFLSRHTIRGSYQIVDKEIKVSDYDEIVVGLAANVIYQQFSDSVPYLQINTDDNILSALDIRVEGNQLIIEAKPDSVIRPTELTIYTNSRNLRKAWIRGSGDLYLRGEVNAGNFELNVSGSGNIRTDSLLCGNLEVNVTGSGNARLIGAAKESTFAVSGSGEIKAFDFLVQFLECKVSGSGNIEAYPEEQLDASVSGSGNIKYKGIPESVKSSVSGSGRIDPLTVHHDNP
ncbi:MAG: DUF2807 domain-containing protein [Dysgonamonadaceae bacterium]|jgi:hypothetical protein|nr:DUF2807 domain-containing protein [Dysgonamonadaceae bacterium]